MRWSALPAPMYAIMEASVDWRPFPSVIWVRRILRWAMTGYPSAIHKRAKWTLDASRSTMSLPFHWPSDKRTTCCKPPVYLPLRGCWTLKRKNLISRKENIRLPKYRYGAVRSDTSLLPSVIGRNWANAPSFRWMPISFMRTVPIRIPWRMGHWLPMRNEETPTSNPIREKPTFSILSRMIANWAWRPITIIPNEVCLAPLFSITPNPTNAFGTRISLPKPNTRKCSPRNGRFRRKGNTTIHGTSTKTWVWSM